MKKAITILFLFLIACLKIHSQQQVIKNNLLPKGYYKAYVDNNDTIAIIDLKEVYIYAPHKFKNNREKIKYMKLVRDVKRTLPYAKLVYETLIETYEYIQYMPEKEQQEHLKRMEKELFKQYKPELKKLTLSQGKLLIKLVNRECNQSSYSIVKAFLGSFRAGFWNFFAGIFGASLKTEYDPDGKDAMIEKIVILVENGQI